MPLIGLRSSHLLTAPVPGAACPACAAAGTLQLRVFGRYVHALGLPLTGVGATGYGQCRQCRHVVGAAGLPAVPRAQLRALQLQTPVPLWHFAGLLLTGLLLLAGPAQQAWQRYHRQQLLGHPHVGDLYHIRSDDPGYYTLLKVVEVNGNSVRLMQNTYETDLENELRSLDQPRYYAPEPIDLTQLDLQIMQQQQELVAVERPD